MRFTKYPSWGKRIRDFTADHATAYLRRGRDEKKPLLRQIADICHLSRFYGHAPHHYLAHESYRRDGEADVCDFLPPPSRRQYMFRANPKEATVNVEDKRQFAKRMQEAGIPAVPVLAFVARGGPLLDAEDQPISFEDLLRRLQESGHGRIFVKPRLGANGEGIFTADIVESTLYVDGRRVNEKRFRKRLFAGGMFDSYLLQPVIQQHEQLNRLNPAAVNTIRIDTLVDGGEIYSSGAVIRIGSGDKCTDHGTAGGFLVKVDLETGALAATARTKAKHGRHVIWQHPRTGCVFGGTVVPFWPEVRQLVVSAACVVLPTRYVGWDLAITPDGPLLIEGNHPPDASMLQDGVGGLRDTPFGWEVIRLTCPRRIHAVQSQQTDAGRQDVPGI